MAHILHMPAARRPPRDLPFTGHTVSEVEGLLVCFGGLAASTQSAATQSAATAVSDVWVRGAKETGWSWLEADLDNSPAARSGHASVSLGSQMLVFGGADAQRRRLDDAWSLEVIRTQVSSSSRMELRLDARVAGAAADADHHRPLLQLEAVRSCLASALSLPRGAIQIEHEAAGEEGVTCSVTIAQMKGVGLAEFGVDGDALPQAAMDRLEARLEAASIVDNHEASSKGPSAADAAHEMRIDAMQRSLVNHRLKGWQRHVTRHEQKSRPAVTWLPLAADPESHAPSPRSGHSATLMASGQVIVYGGMTDSGVAADVWSLIVSSTPAKWSPLATSGLAPARAYHGALARPAASKTSSTPEQVIIFGGSDGKTSALESLHVLSLPEAIWSTPRVAGSAPAPRCWPATTGLVADGDGWRGLVFGGVGRRGQPLGDLASLRVLASASEGTTDPQDADEAFEWVGLHHATQTLPGVNMEAPLLTAIPPSPAPARLTTLGTLLTQARLAVGPNGVSLLGGAARIATLCSLSGTDLVTLEDGEEPQMGGDHKSSVPEDASSRAASAGFLEGVLADGLTDAYRGPFVEGLPHGSGSCTYAEGVLYEGDFAHGLRHGHGTLSLPGKRYTGAFVAGMPAGNGSWTYDCGDRYTGELEGGMRHG